jgi:hypothetical protein
VHKFDCVHQWMCVCESVRVRVCMHASVRVRVCVHANVCVRVCVHASVCVYTCVHVPIVCPTGDNYSLRGQSYILYVIETSVHQVIIRYVMYVYCIVPFPWQKSARKSMQSFHPIRK